MTPCETIEMYHALKSAVKWSNILKQEDKYSSDVFFTGICDYLNDVFKIIERDYKDLGIERKP